ncbi:MAG: hypothetical protein M1830_000250 [Pleopsidium flavum]|nr:MAG: hypothetical protein M1830_000250 [Pleopsidium flavum]
MPPAYTTVAPPGHDVRQSAAPNSTAPRGVPPGYSTVAPPGHGVRQSAAATSPANRSVPPGYTTVAPPGHNPRQSTATTSTANRNVPPGYTTVAPPGHSAAEDRFGTGHSEEHSNEASRTTTQATSTRPPGNAPQPGSSEDKEGERPPTHGQHGSYGLESGRSKVSGSGIKGSSRRAARSNFDKGVEEEPVLSQAHRDARDAQHGQGNMSGRPRRGARSEDDGDDDDVGDRRRTGEGPRRSASRGTSSRRGRRPHDEIDDYYYDYEVGGSHDSSTRRDNRHRHRHQYDGRGDDTRDHESGFRSGRDYNPFEEATMMPTVQTLHTWELDPDEVSLIALVLQVPLIDVWAWAEDGYFQIDVVTGEMRLVEILYQFPSQTRRLLYNTLEERRWAVERGMAYRYTRRR